MIKHYVCFLTSVVMYYTPPVSAARGNMIRKGLTREYIWGCIKGHDISRIGDYQPEDDGYKVLSLHIGTWAISRVNSWLYVQISCSDALIMLTVSSVIKIDVELLIVHLYCRKEANEVQSNQHLNSSVVLRNSYVCTNNQ